MSSLLAAQRDANGTPDGRHPLNMNGDSKADVVFVAAQRAADGSLDEDVPCLSCGYNLRGLKGESVCCPECGTGNDLREALLPKAAIETAINQTEVAPSKCVCWAFFGIMALGLCLFGIAVPITLPVAISLGYLWVASVRRGREHFTSLRAWAWILVQYHLAAGLYVAFLPILLALEHWDSFRKFMVSMVGHLTSNTFAVVFLLVCLPPVTCFGAGILMHRRARKLIRRVQRAQILHLARKIAKEWNE